jgi:hypothetical protein
MRALLATLAPFAVLAAVSCAGGGDEPVPATALKLELTVPGEVRRGEPVPLHLTVENVTEAPVRFWTGGTAESNYVGGYDFVVTVGDEVEAWSWLKSGVIFQGILGGVTLEAGERLEFEQEWRQVDLEGAPVGAGIYVVRGVLRGETEDGQAFELRTVQSDLVISPKPR